MSTLYDNLGGGGRPNTQSHLLVGSGKYMMYEYITLTFINFNI